MQVPVLRPMPLTAQAVTHKFKVADCEVYVSVGLYEDGMPGSITITPAKKGLHFNEGLLNTATTFIGLALQYGVPLNDVLDKMKAQRFEPSGMTSNPGITMAASIINYIGRWMEKEFVHKMPAPHPELGLRS